MVTKGKFLIVCLVAVAIGRVRSLDWPESAKTLHQSCINELGLTAEEVQKLPPAYIGDDMPDKSYCFMKCVLEKMNILKADGTINSAHFDNCPILTSLPPSERSDVENCLIKLSGLDTCGDMKQVFACLKDAMAKLVAGQ